MTLLTYIFFTCLSGIEMDVYTDVSDTGVMSEEQQQRFFKEASDAVYRAKGNLTPEQQVCNVARSLK